MISARQRFAIGLSVAASLALAFIAAPAPARAGDFPHDVEHTFTTDIPHFFQDDIPCAFGGQPTSGAKKSCSEPAKPATQQHPSPPAAPAPAPDASPPPPSAPPDTTIEQQQLPPPR